MLLVVAVTALNYQTIYCLFLNRVALNIILHGYLFTTSMPTNTHTKVCLILERLHKHPSQLNLKKIKNTVG